MGHQGRHGPARFTGHAGTRGRSDGVSVVQSSSLSPSPGDAVPRAKHICQLIVCGAENKEKATEKMQNAFKNTLSFPFSPEAEVLK